MEQTLSLNLANSAGISDSYWLRMRIKEDELSDGMTVAAAAALIDSAYNIKACEQQSSNDIWSQTAEEMGQDIWNDGKATIEQGEENLAAQKRFANELKKGNYDTNCNAGSTSTISELISYEVVVEVYRSHQSELYKLQMANGKAGSVARRSERTVMHIEVENSSSVTLEKPIVEKVGQKTPVIVWQGATATPQINIIGNTLHWDGAVTGTLRAEFYTEWDEVTITVTGNPSDSAMIEGTDQSFFGAGWYSGSETGKEIDDYQNISCSVLAFYHYQYEELILNRPEPDETTSDTDKMSFCHFATSVRAGGGSGKTREEECVEKCPSLPREVAEAQCKKNYDECMESAEGQEDKYNCGVSYQTCLGNAGETKDPDCVEACSNPDCERHVNENIICECDGEKESNNHYEIVPCPDGKSAGSTLEGVERTTYKDCGYRDKVYDPAFYEDKCCVPWPFGDKEMPHCKTIVKPFVNKEPDEDETPLEDRYPDGTNFITVAPADGKCGEWTIEQVLHAKDCGDECDGVPPLLWDSENSAKEVATESSATVCVSGGRLPLTVEIRGAGFYLNAAHTLREAEINSRCFGIFTTAEACGNAKITVSDGCTTTSGSIRSTNGRWVEQPWDDMYCGCDGVNIDSQGGGSGYECDFGEYKITEIARSTSYNACASCNVSDPYVRCMSMDSLTDTGEITNSNPCANNSYWFVDYGSSIGGRCRQALNKQLWKWEC